MQTVIGYELMSVPVSGGSSLDMILHCAYTTSRTAIHTKKGSIMLKIFKRNKQTEPVIEETDIMVIEEWCHVDVKRRWNQFKPSKKVPTNGSS